MNLHHVHYEESVRNPKNETANYIIEKINAEFFEYLEEILSQKENLPPVDVPYYRVVVGEEAEDLLEKFRKMEGMKKDEKKEEKPAEAKEEPKADAK